MDLSLHGVFGMDTIESQNQSGLVENEDSSGMETVIIDIQRYCELIVSHLPLRRLDPVSDRVGDEFIGLMDESSNTRFLLPTVEMRAVS